MRTMYEEPNAVQEIHEIRRRNYEETKDLTPEERCRRTHENTKDIIERLGVRVVPLRARDRITGKKAR